MIIKRKYFSEREVVPADIAAKGKKKELFRRIKMEIGG